jgi:hypothetical protein
MAIKARAVSLANPQPTAPRLIPTRGTVSSDTLRDDAERALGESRLCPQWHYRSFDDVRRTTAVTSQADLTESRRDVSAPAFPER